MWTRSQLWIGALLLPWSLVSCGGDSEEGGAGDASASGSAKRYQVKSAIIEYQISGAQSGKETVYFDDFGRVETKISETELKVAGMTQKTRNRTFFDGEWNYNVDLETNQGSKMKADAMGQLGKRDATQLGEAMMKQMGGKKIGQEDVAGKSCDVWEVASMGSKTWVWKGIPLKTETKMGPMSMTLVATKVDDGASIPAEMRKPLEGIEFKDTSEMLERFRSGK